MPTELRITGSHWSALRGHLLQGDGLEYAAYLICGPLSSDRGLHLLVQDVVALTGADLLDHGELHLSVNPLATARVTKQAKAAGATVVLCHSHPFAAGAVHASGLDRSTESDLCGRVLTGRLQLPVGALVVSPDGVDGSVWSPQGMRPLDKVTIIGDTITTVVPTGARLPAVGDHGGDSTTNVPSGTRDARRHDEHDPDNQDNAQDQDKAQGDPGDELERVDRQVRAWGRAGQDRLASAHIGVIGCGGTGSHVVQQLAHLGVRNLVLVDPDRLEGTNLSRVVGSTPADVGRDKVDVLASSVAAINEATAVRTYPHNVLDVDPHVLAGLDLIFACTDGHGSRAFLTEVAQQYLVPVIDLGVEVVAGRDGATAGGGVRVLRPGSGCLLCSDTLSSELIRQEYLGDTARAHEAVRGYLRDVTEPAPSVIALNGVVASLAVLEACQMLAGMYPTPGSRLLFRGQVRRLSTTMMPRDPACHVCGDQGLLGRGESEPTSTRWVGGDTRESSHE